MSLGTYMEAREQLLGVCSLLPLWWVPGIELRLSAFEESILNPVNSSAQDLKLQIDAEKPYLSKIHS